MAAVSIYALSAPYANFMLNQAPARSGVCRTCWTFIDPAYDECRQCAYGPTALVEAMVPITYSIDGEQMHHELRHYKDSRSAGVQQRMMRGLAAVLWRFLDEHELCIAEAAGRQGLFDLVVTVPSKSTVRDDQRSNLRTIVGSLCEHT